MGRPKKEENKEMKAIENITLKARSNSYIQIPPEGGGEGPVKKLLIGKPYKFSIGEIRRLMAVADVFKSGRIYPVDKDKFFKALDELDEDEYSVVISDKDFIELLKKGGKTKLKDYLKKCNNEYLINHFYNLMEKYEGSKSDFDYENVLILKQAYEYVSTFPSKRKEMKKVG